MKTITLTFTEQETSVLVSACDALAKAHGVKAVQALAPILGKIDAAIAETEDDNGQGD